MNVRTLIAFLLFAFVGPACAASQAEIDAEVRQALQDFRKHTAAGHELSQQAAGMLIFPSVIKAGIGIGGEYGEGALLVKGKTVAYYNIASASIGLQLGAQARSQIVLFMNDKVLAELGKHEGIHIPRGFYYWFESCSDEVLELMQVEAVDLTQKQNLRLNATERY